MMDAEKLRVRAKAAEKDNRALFKRLAGIDSRRLDDLVHRLHDEVFALTDCLACANCCKTLGPRITDADISRISPVLKIRPSKFTEIYLSVDDDGDFVFKSMPCPFLGHDNYCSIYDVRPKACREYPHTDRRRISQILPLTLKNSYICPAVFDIIEKLKRR